MQINVNATGSRPVVALVGRFDAHEVAAFRSRVDPMVAARGTVVVVDFSDVVFVDSAALAELVRAMKHARSCNGDVVISSPSAPVRIILELTGLDRAFTVEDASLAGSS
jgi:anti-sigma B factor antagonist